MNETLKLNLMMVARYFISVVAFWLANSGYLPKDIVGPVTEIVLQVLLYIVAALPPLYAWYKVSNRPRWMDRP